jgi:hypothetical protein
MSSAVKPSYVPTVLVPGAGKRRGRTMPVGSLTANPWGLCERLWDATIGAI